MNRQLTAWMSALGIGCICMCGGGCRSTGASGGDVAGDAAMRRDTLLQLARTRGHAAVPALAEALADTNPVVRRTAARLLAAQGEAAEAGLRTALENDDALVRRTALRGLAELNADPAFQVDVLRLGIQDPDSSVRLYAVTRLAAIRPRSEAIEEVIRLAEQDETDAVRSIASSALWPFHRDVVSIRNRADWDHDVEVVQSIPLPRDDWRFRLDPRREGHRKNWYKPAYADSAWDTIAIEQAWQQAGYEYTGVTWYRRWVELPAKPADAFNAVEISFSGVDESAWVWVNGVYVGEHDIGPTGWDRPFSLDITKEIKWGEKNQITVRAMNTAHAGGIWRPVVIDILK